MFFQCHRAKEEAKLVEGLTTAFLKSYQLSAKKNAGHMGAPLDVIIDALNYACKCYTL